MSWKENWLECLNSSGEDFGHNCWHDIKDTIKQFKRLEVHGAKIYICDDNPPPLYNIRLKMPRSSIAQANILYTILIDCPPPSNTRWTTLKNQRVLDVEWHW